MKAEAGFETSCKSHIGREIANHCGEKQKKTKTKRLKVRFKLSIKYLDAVYQPYQGCHDVRHEGFPLHTCSSCTVQRDTYEKQEDKEQPC